MKTGSRVYIVMMKIRFAFAASLALAPMFAASAQSQPPQQPPRAWLQCRACHTIKAVEPNKVGPNLNKVFGAKAGTVRPNFAYSPALKASTIVGNDRSLDSWLANPAATIRGNRMAYPGLADPAQRRALIAWLRRAAR